MWLLLYLDSWLGGTTLNPSGWLGFLSGYPLLIAGLAVAAESCRTARCCWHGATEPWPQALGSNLKVTSQATEKVQKNIYVCTYLLYRM